MAEDAGSPAWESVVTKLVTERGDALTRYAYLISGSPDDAADLVQDALVKTFSRVRNGFSVASAEAYVRRAILNTFLDGGRRRTRWRKVAHLVLASDVAESRATATEAQIDMRAELMKLSPRERACIVLRYYEDLKVDDIAEWLDISPGTVKRYLSDGLARMAVAMQPDRATATDIEAGENRAY
ncbi:sigma-70 family RNA polymerase sigma factor [Salinibacterium sp. ZJ454]|uniref:RNA polymerase sigma factor n=1 Tax=Salinibacterium sp. ZJ454 TaxID=2708339 RepID=UPI00141F7492|nr:sigma-70 family RNA polymerase sigma factor [Salinibacterium sp. ZJ454]